MVNRQPYEYVSDSEDSYQDGYEGAKPPGRPGIPAKVPDHALTEAELARRNRRRARNREAATRQRDRRAQKVAMLEEEVAVLQRDKKELKSANESLRDELEQIRMQMKIVESARQASPPPRAIVYQHVEHQPVTSSAGQIILTDGNITPVFAVTTPSYMHATAMASSQFQFPATMAAKVERVSSGSISEPLFTVLN